MKKSILKTTLMDVAPKVGSKRFPYPNRCKKCGRNSYELNKAKVCPRCL